MTRGDIAAIAARVAGAAGGVLFVGLLIGGVLGHALIYSAALLGVALLALVVVFLAG